MAKEICPQLCKCGCGKMTSGKRTGLGNFPEYVKGHKTCFKKGHSSLLNQEGEKNNQWKKNPGYSALHKWIQRKLGKPKKCAFCYTQSAQKFEWANISGKYKRDLNDWVRLCVPCHSFFDNRPETRRETMKRKRTEKYATR